MADVRRYRPGIGVTIICLVIVVVFMGAYYSIITALGIRAPVFGIFFFLYWAAILRRDSKLYLPSLLGGASGILLGAFLLEIPARFGMPGMIGGYVLTAAVLFCYIRQDIAILINNSMMVYLTLTTLPEMDCQKNWPHMLAALAIGGAYMGLWSLLINYLLGKLNIQGASPPDAIERSGSRAMS